VVREATRRTKTDTDVTTLVHDLEKHPVAAFGKLAQQAAEYTFEKSYVGAKVRLNMNTATTAYAPGPTITKAANSRSFTPGDLPVPPPLKADGPGKLAWATRLAWAHKHCASVRTAAVDKCTTARGKADCEDQDKSSCRMLRLTARRTCHHEHHQAYRTCAALWQAARAEPVDGVGISVNDGVYTRRDVQLHAAHKECATAFAKQHQHCSRRYDTSHEACEKLTAGVPTGAKAALEKARDACAKGTKRAREFCQRGHA